MSSIFISYAREDSTAALRLWRDLRSAGLCPWIDSEEIAPGENWSVAIKTAIRNASRFIIILSNNSVTKRGYVQTEIRFALDQLSLHPPNSVFIIPVRLDDVTPSHDRLRELQWLDLFPSYDAALARLLESLDGKEKLAPAVADSALGTQEEIINDPAHVGRSSLGFGGDSSDEPIGPIDNIIVLREVEITLNRRRGVVVKAEDRPMGQISLSLKNADGGIEELVFTYSGVGISRGDQIEVLYGESFGSNGAVPLFFLNRSTGENRDLLKTSVALYKLGVNDSLSTAFLSLVVIGVGFVLSMASLDYLMKIKDLPSDFLSVLLVIGPLLVPAAVGLYFVARKQREIDKMSVDFEKYLLESISSFWR